MRGVTAHQLGAEHEDSEDISDVMLAEAKKAKICNVGDKVVVMVG